MQFDILTVFTDYFDVLKCSLLGKAIDDGKLSVNVVDIRDYSQDKHKKTDDAPYGGGAGMVMTPDPIVRAIEAVDPKHEALRIYMSPRGKTLNQAKVEKLAKRERILLLCGDYEGIDERVIDLCIDEEISIGDYVLTGGEIPAVVITDAVVRLIPGVIGDEQSALSDSFQDNLLAPPIYTRPADYNGWRVPDILLSGHQARIDQWRYDQAVERTRLLRPGLLDE